MQHRDISAMADDAGATSRTEESGTGPATGTSFGLLAFSLAGLEADDDLFEYLELKRKEVGMLAQSV